MNFKTMLYSAYLGNIIGLIFNSTDYSAYIQGLVVAALLHTGYYLDTKNVKKSEKKAKKK